MDAQVVEIAVFVRLEGPLDHERRTRMWTLTGLRDEWYRETHLELVSFRVVSICIHP